MGYTKNTRADTEQALVFLSAATQVDNHAGYVLPAMLRIISRYATLNKAGSQGTSQQQDYSQLVYQLLQGYTNDSADFLVLRNAVQYLLKKLNSREERVSLLQSLLNDLKGKNSRLDSYLNTRLGLLMSEKTDLQTAALYLMNAYNKNNYNNLAFSKLAELTPQQIKPSLYLKQLRLTITEDPLDITAAIDFAQYAEKLQLYQTAADAYEYSADLFSYLDPSEPLPAYIYLPWAICCYNTERNQHKCLQIAKDLRETDRFDLFLEAIAGKAAEKTEGIQKATQVFQNAEEKALRLFAENIQSSSESRGAIYCPPCCFSISFASSASSDEGSFAIAELRFSIAEFLFCRSI